MLKLLKDNIKEHFALYHVPDDGSKSILLTFDDGPHPLHTPKILDMLDGFSVKAIFFVPGCRIITCPDLLNQILARGHILGNHSHAHSAATYGSVRRTYRDILECQDLIHRHTGLRPTLYRPPFGTISPSAIISARLHGLKVVKWSIESGEYNRMRNKNSLQIASAFINNARSGDISLLHDDSAKVVEALPIILPGLVARGFGFHDPSRI